VSGLSERKVLLALSIRWLVAVAADCFGSRRRRLIRCDGCFCIMNIESLPDDRSRAFRRLERLSGPGCRQLDRSRVV
jgi:hypothetical protein